MILEYWVATGNPRLTLSALQTVHVGLAYECDCRVRFGGPHADIVCFTNLLTYLLINQYHLKADV